MYEEWSLDHAIKIEVINDEWIMHERMNDRCMDEWMMNWRFSFPSYQSSLPCNTSKTCFQIKLQLSSRIPLDYNLLIQLCVVQVDEEQPKTDHVFFLILSTININFVSISSFTNEIALLLNICNHHTVYLWKIDTTWFKIFIELELHKNENRVSKCKRTLVLSFT